ncbi:MAG: ATPase [Flavobacteriaceae bacterium CG_4_8_14_3_um_filter_34_10]|nr:ATPase [Flavobacteriia bacterium]OIP49846.1 MAG: ATPase [Flavobacteriaceae bacterium CG2_30_34_30]PIQ18910.1 MAG: ATPase [Flavobacteriaceae bacterium CG18_big_fil_WC_8_21_14_2_50_34_36]PIV48963.1 MAG: ATPase [Flavobacteriaceae bacterium CG02_land_8_20_14_3_00_34_13]PIX10468.1 MAG: ATPase [Flavobacteriaceae bacterium CG_4_8_14_3_um_filter_34_10]PIZ08633.1 MAG: ATPase [Flavobacteriaceae bacterium CG_4_10_14_0_8_um_filter_34_31]PJC07222.1 MAG: ATPase [Flavobacteriaceae bacterium CG_4_9_14_0_8
MQNKNITIIKASGEKVDFSSKKVATSLKRAGATEEMVQWILNKIEEELYVGISTKEIYNRAFNLLKKKNSFIASKYKLKKAIYELGPTGFPFEKFVAAILKNTGYKVEIGQILQGACVSHEIDVMAQKDGELFLIECKFHSLEGSNCDVKVPLYIDSRYRDIVRFNAQKAKKKLPIKQGWVVTNTRFTEDALAYGKCSCLHLLSWDYPKGKAIKDQIDSTGLYPITVSTLLTSREKQFLLSRDVVLCLELINDHFFLDHLGISDTRKEKILKEMESLCKH